MEKHVMYGPHIDLTEDGKLRVEGVLAEELVAKYGTPLFVFSENTVRENYRAIRNAFKKHYPGDLIVCAGMKANWGLAVRRIIASEGGGGDAFGLGELTVAALAGTDLKKLVMNGANKSRETIEAAIDADVLINVDNEDEIELIEDVARQKRRTARITLRIRLPLEGFEEVKFVDPRYPEGISPVEWERTFKFGLEPESFKRAVHDVLQKKDYLSLEGVMYHGGMPRRAGMYKEETRELIQFIAHVWNEYKFQLKYLDIGGGFVPKRYGAETEPPSADIYAKEISVTITEECARHGIDVPTLIIEPGRYCFDSACIWITRVGSIKEDATMAMKKWVYVDGNTNDMKDPFDPYNRVRHIVIANDGMRDGEKEEIDICGQLCSADDILTKNLSIVRLRRGDLLAYLDMGAYNESYVSQANATARTATVMVNNGRHAVVRRRETIADVLSRETIPTWLLNKEEQ